MHSTANSRKHGKQYSRENAYNCSEWYLLYKDIEYITYYSILLSCFIIGLYVLII